MTAGEIMQAVVPVCGLLHGPGRLCGIAARVMWRRFVTAVSAAWAWKLVGRTLPYRRNSMPARSRSARCAASRRPLAAEALETRQLLAADPVINEFLTRNDGGLRDGDGRSSDWIELYNPADSVVDLSGYRLTDEATNRTKWTFPSVTLGPGQYLVVFASGQARDDYVDPDGHLHTNFTLRRGGGYLALVAPDGRVLSEFGTDGSEYAAQLVNVSFGGSQRIRLIHSRSPARYLIPLDDRFDPSWTQPELDAVAAGFAEGSASLGFESRPGDRTNFVGRFHTPLPGQPHAVYARMEFNLHDASALSALTLRLNYDNGFIAYLNGVKVAAQNAPAQPAWFSTAPENTPRDADALVPIELDLSGYTGALVDGRNVLALHGLNHPADTSDMLLIAELDAVTDDMLAATGLERAAWAT